MAGADQTQYGLHRVGLAGRYVSRRDKAWEAKHNVPPDDQQAVELYNLAEDIGQRKNLAASHPERVAQLQALLKQIRQQGYSAPRLAE